MCFQCYVRVLARSAKTGPWQGVYRRQVPCLFPTSQEDVNRCLQLRTVFLGNSAEALPFTRSTNSPCMRAGGANVRRNHLVDAVLPAAYVNDHVCLHWEAHQGRLSRVHQLCVLHKHHIACTNTMHQSARCCAHLNFVELPACVCCASSAMVS